MKKLAVKYVYILKNYRPLNIKTKQNKQSSTPFIECELTCARMDWSKTAGTATCGTVGQLLFAHQRFEITGRTSAAHCQTE